MGGATSLGQYGASHIFSLKYTTSSDVQLRSISISVIQLARLSGFSPIITTASTHNAKFLQSIGATHVLDRFLPESKLQAEASAIGGGPFSVVYDAVSEPQTVGLAYALTAPRGDLVIVHPAEDIQQSATKDDSMKRVHVAFGLLAAPFNRHLAASLLSSLPQLLESGEIKVSNPLSLPVNSRRYIDDM